LALNKASQQAMKNSKYTSDQVAFKLFDLLDETLDKLIDEKYNGII